VVQVAKNFLGKNERTRGKGSGALNIRPFLGTDPKIDYFRIARHSEATKNLKEQPPTHAAQLQFSASRCTISIRR
jgi:hypothetical protein